jgi:arginine repressor
MEVLRGPEPGLDGNPRNRLNTIRRMVEQTGPESQREVQRLLGRCLLRLQQYERLLKALIARREISGAVHEIESRLAERAAEVEKLTLGSLMKSLFGEVVVIEGRVTDEHAYVSRPIRRQ